MNSPVILVTGAGKGIGEATVKAILEAADLQDESSSKPRLVLTARTRVDLEKLQTLCQQKHFECEILDLELSSNPTLPIEFTLKRFGRIDTLIHSAGVGKFGDFLSLTADDLTFVMKTNIEASFLLMQATYREMQKQKSGDIVWITSTAAETAYEQSALYCMSKFAQKGLLEVMRLYARRDGIRIIDVKPGATLTPMWGEVTDEMRTQMMAADDIAQMILSALALPKRASVEEIVIRPLRGDL
jgi:sepiapterin reductase